jgi:hypothetical protein
MGKNSPEREQESCIGLVVSAALALAGAVILTGSHLERLLAQRPHLVAEFGLRYAWQCLGESMVSGR